MWLVEGPAPPLDVASQPDTAGGGTLQQPNPFRSSARSRHPLLGCCNDKVRYEASSYLDDAPSLEADTAALAFDELPFAAACGSSAGHVSELLYAGGEETRPAVGGPSEWRQPASAVQQAVTGLTQPESFAQRQREDSLLGQVCQHLNGYKARPGEQVEVSGYDVRDDGLLRFRDSVGRRRLVVPQSMIPDVLVLVQTLQSHAGIGATVAIVSTHFFRKTPVRK